ncbi:MAG: glutamate--tRNA ligase [Cryomorphaceae bacterium BACL18 MAG-120924-bin36]|jgi:glutamyl-tRNA synthetase|nr:MAG: glutamate--tRNA ligase [Cryomorphaceae bacterium BACL18 MAG-120924-bin36]
MSDRRVRVRFAPSPTGPLHMGGVRTALYNYLFAKKLGGDFLLRIEDTDQTRFVPGAEQYIVDALAWCGISPDEGIGVNGQIADHGPHAPYRQSDRKPMYRAYADQLLAAGHAYYAFDTPEELEAIRERSKSAGNPNWQYNSITRTAMKNSLTLPEDEVARRLDAGDAYVIRVKMPRNEEVKFEDRIRGWVSVNTLNLDDKVLLKGDGMPTYHLANVVDDHLMEITHVIRGEEWLPSAPLHVLLYRFFGWEQPEFAHLPLLLRPDGNGKLSKRDGDRLGFPVFPLNWANAETGETASGYRERGFYPEGFVNMLAFLGWNPGTNQEIFTLDELVQAFSIDKVHKAGARFDFEKAKWFNQQHLRQRSPEVLASEYQAGVAAAFGATVGTDFAAKALTLFLDRAEFISDAVHAAPYLFAKPSEYDAVMVGKKWTPESAGHLRSLAPRWAATDYTESALEEAFKAFLAETGLGFGAVGPVVRLAIAGTTQGPSIFGVMELLGRAECELRIESAIVILG